jgi:hypothetical protein
MLPSLIQLATVLGKSIGTAIVVATVRYLEKKSLIKHFRQKINELSSK